jgi:hypothetical protein
MVSPAITPARPLRQGRAGSPCVRVAGGWLARTGSLPAGLPVEVNHGDRLLAAALGQLEAGADLAKLSLDGPDRDSSPLAPPTRSTSRSRPSMPAGPR